MVWLISQPETIVKREKHLFLSQFSISLVQLNSNVLSMIHSEITIQSLAHMKWRKFQATTFKILINKSTLNFVLYLKKYSWTFKSFNNTHKLSKKIKKNTLTVTFRWKHFVLYFKIFLTFKMFQKYP